MLLLQGLLIISELEIILLSKLLQLLIFELDSLDRKYNFVKKWRSYHRELCTEEILDIIWQLPKIPTRINIWNQGFDFD